jgi:hypothetical protein
MQAEMDRSIAANADNETLYDQPEKSKTKLRITGPFTVEAVPFPTVLSLESAEGGAATPTEDQSLPDQHRPQRRNQPPATVARRAAEDRHPRQGRPDAEVRRTGGDGVGTTSLHATGTWPTRASAPW